jgi:hypothetical protein
VHSGAAGNVILLATRVVLVLRRACFTQVFEPIVCSISIPVVNLTAAGPSAMDVNPGQRTCTVVVSVNSDHSVAVIPRLVY